MKSCPNCGEPLETSTVRRMIGVTLDEQLRNLLNEYKVTVSQVLISWEQTGAPLPKPYHYERSTEGVQVVASVSEALYDRIQASSEIGTASAFCRGIIFDNVALTSLM